MRMVSFEPPRCDLDCVYAFHGCGGGVKVFRMAQSENGGKRQKKAAKPPHHAMWTRPDRVATERIVHIVETSESTMQKVDSVHNIDLPALGRYVQG